MLIPCWCQWNIYQWNFDLNHSYRGFPICSHLFPIYFPWSSQLYTSIFFLVHSYFGDFPWDFFMTKKHHEFSPIALAPGATRGEILPIFQHLQLLGLLQDLLGSWCPVSRGSDLPGPKKKDHGFPWKVLHFDVCFLCSSTKTWWFQMIFRLEGRETCGKIKYGYSMIMHDYYGFLGSQTWRFSALVQGEASLESVWIRRIWPPIMALTSHCFLTSEPLGLQKTE